MTQEEWKDIFGDNLKSLLQDRGMTQLQLSRESGVSTTTISECINKRTMPGLTAAINMAYALGVPIEEFVDFEEPID